MKVKFNIHYHTQWGQSMYLLMYGAAQSKAEPVKYAMQCNEDDSWSSEIEIPETKAIHYSYAISNTVQALEFEFGPLRLINLDEPCKTLIVNDSWRSPREESPFHSGIFTECFFKRTPIIPSNPKNGNLILRLNCPHMEPGRHLAITGNQELLGNWDVTKKIRLDESEFPVWSIRLDADKIKFPLEYKYLIVDTQTDEVLSWGGGANRNIADADLTAVTYVTDEHFIRQIPSWKAAGVAIPVFSLRSSESFGVGEFYDLKKMIDWAKTTGQRFIQTLPINDTTLYHTNYDSYPYNAVSVYALHPIYLHLDGLGKLRSKKQRDYFAAKQQELNELSFADYQNVMNAKWEFFRAIYPQESATVFESADYKTFFKNNKEWLVPYAAFSYLRDQNSTPSFGKWPEYSVYKKTEIERLVAPQQPHYDQIAIYYFLQYHLHRQLVEVHDYARANGIAIKGDIPIGVSPRSVDAWVAPDLFDTSLQAGAPPDDFSTTGQNWGFPTYNWEKMEKDGYLWWKKRFHKLAEYFDAYRIDHILGFFRIWGIPSDAVWGLTGSFQPSLPFTREELEAKGLQWDEDRFTKPFLKEHVLNSIFGKYAPDVIREFFVSCGRQCYKFKPEFDTQKKIERHFASLDYNFGTKEVLIRDGLYMLHCEVIFVRDIHNPDKFHPRIALKSSASFRDLPENTRQLLDQIYVDYYYHRHNEFWKQQALKKLPALISATNMLVCGEDLGMVPDSVPEVMQNLEILSLEIQRMPKRPNTEFAMPADAPYLSVCTTSTHDMNPVRAWWEEDPALTQRFYNRALGFLGKAPETCEPWIAEQIVAQHLHSSAMLVILPWQDWMALDESLRSEQPSAERINVPSNPRNFWCYRMHITLEQLLQEDSFNQKIKTMVEESGR